jgi:hypothetical protein
MSICLDHTLTTCHQMTNISRDCHLRIVCTEAGDVGKLESGSEADAVGNGGVTASN